MVHGLSMDGPLMIHIWFTDGLQTNCHSWSLIINRRFKVDRSGSGLLKTLLNSFVSFRLLNMKSIKKVFHRNFKKIKCSFKNIYKLTGRSYYTVYCTINTFITFHMFFFAQEAREKVIFAKVK
jgi:hypothetical protein